MARWIYDDGGRSSAGFTGTAGDCATRAIAIATQRPYQEVYDAINRLGALERKGRCKRGTSNARTGTYSYAERTLLKSYGWEWVPTMWIGSGCQTHLIAEELPSGRLICRLSHHLVAVIDGVIHDLYDCSRDGSRCVYGYYKQREGGSP